MSEAEVKAFVGERCEEILAEVAEILGVKSPEEVLEAVQEMMKPAAPNVTLEAVRLACSTFPYLSHGVVTDEPLAVALHEWMHSGYPGTREARDEPLG